MAQRKSRSKRAREARVSDPGTRSSETRAPGQRDVVTTVRDAELGIIQALIDEAKRGNHQTARFLFDYAGLSHQPVPEENDPSLAQVLLERLGLNQESRQERENSADIGHSPANSVNGGARS